MIQPDDLRVKERGEFFKKLKEENPHRDWKYNLTLEQIANLEKLQAEQDANKDNIEKELDKLEEEHQATQQEE